jgi:hypothetical protein
MRLRQGTQEIGGYDVVPLRLIERVEQIPTTSAV